MNNIIFSKIPMALLRNCFEITLLSNPVLNKINKNNIIQAKASNIAMVPQFQTSTRQKPVQ